MCVKVVCENLRSPHEKAFFSCKDLPQCLLRGLLARVILLMTNPGDGVCRAADGRQEPPCSYAATRRLAVKAAEVGFDGKLVRAFCPRLQGVKRRKCTGVLVHGEQD